MPPRKGQQDTPGPIDPSEPIPGSDVDVSEPAAGPTAGQPASKPRSKSLAPEPGKDVLLRGQVIKLPPRLGRKNNRPYTIVGVHGVPLDRTTGQPVGEPRNWKVTVEGFQAQQSLDKLRKDGEVVLFGKWTREDEMSFDNSPIDSIKADLIAFPLDGLSLEATATQGLSIAE